MKRSILFSLIGLPLSSLAQIPGISSSSGLDTATVMKSAASTSCMDYQTVGVCYWLDCDKKCKVHTSVKVKHFVPEAVISTYADTGKNPWTDVAWMSPTSIGAEGGVDVTTASSGKNTQTRFKNADVIGHPGGSLLGSVGLGYTCESTTTAYYPYFLSTLDIIGWRFGIPEMVYPESLAPGLREVGSMASGNMWGNIFPREGLITQTDDFKAAAVTAQKAADITTRTGQAHIYTTIKASSAKDGYWPPNDPVMENDSSNHCWQQLYPEQKDSCSAFPDREMTTRSAGDSYVFALWRPYRCFKQVGQEFLGSTGF